MRRCIIDKNARIGSNCKIINTANVQEANKEEDGYVIKDGIVVVIKSSVFPGKLPAFALALYIWLYCMGLQILHEMFKGPALAQRMQWDPP